MAPGFVLAALTRITSELLGVNTKNSERLADTCFDALFGPKPSISVLQKGAKRGAFAGRARRCPRRDAGLFRVHCAISTAGQPLPVYPDNRTSSGHAGMSGLCHEETHAPQQRAELFDHLVGASEERLRHREAQRFCSLQIDKKFIVGRRLNRKIGRFFPLENAIDIVGNKPRS
jgi:hypothetical protein